MAANALWAELTLYGSDDQPLQAGESIYSPEAVTAHASVSNPSELPTSSLDVQWLLDGQVVDGKSEGGLAASGSATFTTTLTPPPGQHEIALRVDADPSDDFDPATASVQLNVLSQDDAPSMHEETGLPTGRDYAVGVQYAQPLIQWAEHDATDYAAKFNEWARYNGNEEGAKNFIAALPEAIEGHWWKVTKEFVEGFIKDIGAANAAGDIARLKDNYFEQFADGFLAAIEGGQPGGTDDPVLAQVAQNVAAEVAGYGADVGRGLRLYCLKQSSTGEQVDLSDESVVAPSSLWNAGNSFVRQGLLTVLHDRG